MQASLVIECDLMHAVSWALVSAYEPYKNAKSFLFWNVSIEDQTYRGVTLESRPVK